MPSDQALSLARSDPGMLERAVMDAGGVLNSGAEGDIAFSWDGRPRAFILLRTGKISVRFRTRERIVPWAECRASAGQDCMPVTAAILSERDITVRATCRAPSTWIELSPTSLILLVHTNPEFRRALFAQHAQRLPTFFARISGGEAISFDQRLAEWLLANGTSGEIRATHQKIAADLITAREVVSRHLKVFADRGWIDQARGRITVSTPQALAHLVLGDDPQPPATQ